MLGVGGYEREYRFAPPRRWRFDFAWPLERVAVEIEGGIWTGGRHVSVKGFVSDCDKYNAAVLDGWAVLRFSSPHIHYQIVEAVETLKKLLHRRATSSGDGKTQKRKSNKLGGEEK